MWITTIRGFVSAVADNQKPGNMLLRFRSPRHRRAVLSILPKQYTYVSTPAPADYRWKVSIPLADFVELLTGLAAEAQLYNNFKGACSRSRPMAELGRELHDTWAVWEAVQRREERELETGEKPKPGRKRRSHQGTLGLESTFDSAD